MKAALRVEWWKLRRSRVPVTATILVVVLLPAMGLGFHAVAKDGGTGPLAQKAGALLTGEGWAGYLGAIDQIAAAAMFLGAGVVVSWVFGREHADRTFAALFALPVPRRTIAGAKFLVLLGWGAALSVLVVAGATVAGLLAGVGAVEAVVVVPEVARLFAVALSATVLALPVAFVASAGRGYLPAFGALVLTVAAAQIAVLVGTGAWFPFAVPGLLAVSGTPGVPRPTTVQVALVPVTVLLGAGATLRWWQRTEVV